MATGTIEEYRFKEYTERRILWLAEIKGEVEMAEQTADLSKLMAVATDFDLSAKLRTKAIELIGDMHTQEALRALLDLVANEKLTKNERQLALKFAGEIVKSSPQ